MLQMSLIQRNMAEDLVKGYNVQQQLSEFPQHVQENIVMSLGPSDDWKSNIAMGDIYHYLDAAKKIPDLSRLKEHCENTQIQSLCDQNAVYMLHLALDFGLESLSTKAKVHLCDHLTSITPLPDFSTLATEQLMEILELHIRKFKVKDSCIEALNAWGQGIDSNLHDQIRDFIHKTYDNAVHVVHLDSSKDRVYFLAFSADQQGKIDAIVRDVADNKLYTANCTQTNGKKLTLPNNFAVCSYHGGEGDIEEPPSMLVAGGSSKNSQKTVLEYDFVEADWKNRRDMLHGRQQHSLCVANSDIYAIGGYTTKHKEKRLVSAIERFDFNQNSWKEVAELPVPVYSCACAIVGNRIFLLGGKNEDDGDVAFIQMFDTITETVTLRGRLPDACSGGTAEAVGNTIYLATDSGQLVRLDTETMEIRKVHQQPEVSDNFTLFPLDDSLMLSYYGRAGDCGGISSYVYGVCQDWWSPHDRYDVASGRVLGQCRVVYPRSINHIPFCD